MQKTIVTLFRSLFDSRGVSYHIELERALDRIKNGKSKELIQQIRAESDKDKRGELKKKSVSILFNGKFSTRSQSGLIEHSGACVLDFDGFEDNTTKENYKDLLRADKYILCAFDSPSGNGLKALVKIPKCDADEHKLYFSALENYFDSQYFDKSGCDVSRVCFESYDPTIYINWKSETFTEKIQAEGYSFLDRPPTLPLRSEDEIINRLLKWWQSKFTYSEGERNNNLFKLAIAMNDYGVPEYVCNNYLNTNFDLPEPEINALCRSAYSNQGKFGTKYFEDTGGIKKLRETLKAGANQKEVVKKLSEKIGDVGAEALVKEISTSLMNYWTITDKGKVIINNFQLKEFLEANGFFKYYPELSESPILVNVESNRVRNCSVEKIKDFILSDLLTRGVNDVWNYMASATRYFQDSYLNMLESIDLKMLEDKKGEAYIYFKNLVVKVTPDKIIEIDYPDIDGYIWEKQIINREFKRTRKTKNDFQDLIKKVCNDDPQRVLGLENTLGYLMHSFKDKTDQKAIIFNDQEINDDPNGGSGKSLMLTALGYFKKMVKIDGKSFDPSGSDFVYQRVDLDTQVLAFDDAKKNLNFENLFSLITEGITVNRKNQPEIFIPFERSPKIIITTNYVINGSGTSHDRRRHEIEFFQYFNNQRTPLDEYGKLLFDEWNETEWTAFDNYMMELIQGFLKNGLTVTESINAEIKRFIQSTSKEFYDFIQEGHLPIGEMIYNDSFHKEFISEFTDFENINIRTLKKWVKRWAELKGYVFSDGKSGSQRYFTLTTEKPAHTDEKGNTYPF